MKKIPFLLTMLLCLSLSAQAQFYFAPQVGYAFPTSTEPFELNDISVTSTPSSSTYTEDVVFSSLGGGFNAGLAAGFFFNSYLGVEVSGQYLLGSNVSATADVGGLVTTINRETQQLRFTGSMVVQAPTGTVKPYAKFGLLVPAGGKTTTVLEEPTLNPITMETGKARYELETKGAFSLGYTSSFGVLYSVSDNIGIFGELCLQSLSIRANTTEVISATLDGTDILPGIDTYDRKTNYLDQLTQTSNNEGINPGYSTDQPEDAIRIRTQFGSMGLNLGVRIGL